MGVGAEQALQRSATRHLVWVAEGVVARLAQTGPFARTLAA